ncbi:MAG: molybdate ABC transporter permease subunit [Gammaproteobacteria bacterium]|nr:MAG: molybdate ABC transporter permease subunit [Gammaproteobacteria bacterium]
MSDELLWPAVLLTGQLALSTTLLLLIISVPLAWWLVKTRSIFRPWIEAVIALPLALPPTVLGFYLLVLLGHQGFIGQWMTSIGLEPWVFRFPGLLVGSLLYSLPFAVHPLQTAFRLFDMRLLESAKTLGAGPWRCFVDVVLPQTRNGFLTAAVLSFAHTVGEFGVVLMVGGNIPGQTQVLSTLIYDRVEAMDYQSANQIAIGLLLFSITILWWIYARLGHRD